MAIDIAIIYTIHISYTYVYVYNIYVYTIIIKNGSKWPMNTWSHLESEAMVGTWKDARVSGHCLASACDDTGNSATLGDSSTEWVDMCGLDDLRCEQRLLN